jgi:hypothetical protein
MFSGFLSPLHGIALGCGWRRRTADMEGGCKYLEYARTADKGRSCNVRVDEKLRIPHRHKSASYKMLYRAFGESWERPRQWKVDMRIGIWNARRL